MFDEKCQKQQELWRAFGLGWQTHFLRWIYHTHREHTHTDQYLNFDGHHHLGHKKSVVKTIFCCFNTVISKEEDRTQEIEHLKSILHDSNYKAWLWKILEKEREKQRAVSTKQNSNASQVSLSPTYKVRAFHKQGVNTNHVLWKATILSYWGNIYSTIKIQQEVPLMSKWHIFYCDLGQSFLLLETFISSNHEIVIDLQTNGLKYLVVTFCIVYDLQKMLGCASFTLEMQIKISIILHRGQQSNKGFPNKHNSTYIVTLTVTFVSN